MNYCPITYEAIQSNQTYSQRGLRLLAPTLENLKPLELSAAQQREEARDRSGKMSIQGVQPKLSAILKPKAGCFKLVDQYGLYILKPPSDLYPELPENEAITMMLATEIGIEIPIHGLIRSVDGSMTYFIKRFDRKGQKTKFAVEDFAQLSGYTRDTKYNSSMEQVIRLIEKFCSFPRVEAVKLFKLVLFNFLVGNEDMHLKNFSVITHEKKVTLSPAYDLLNTTIVQKRVKEEIALPLNGKKNNLGKKELLHYLPEKLQLNKQIVEKVEQQFKVALPKWETLINKSFLSKAMKEKYLQLLHERCGRLELFS